MNESLNGKILNVLAGNVVFDVKASMPALFSELKAGSIRSACTITSITSEPFEIAVVSDNGNVCDWFLVSSGVFKVEDVKFVNLLIRSTNANTVYCYTSVGSSF